MNKNKQYAILNLKNLTLKEYFLAYDDFGKVYIKYSQSIVDFGECKKFVNPIQYYIDKVYQYRHDVKNELCEILENKSYDFMVNEFEKLF